MGGKLLTDLPTSSAKELLKAEGTMVAFSSLATTGLLAGLIGASQVSAIPPSAQVPDAQILRPVDQWNLVPSDTQCEVARQYGQSDDPIILKIHESISRGFFELMVVGTTTGPAVAEELQGSIDFAGTPISRWALHSTGDHQANMYTFGLTPSEISKIAVAPSVGVKVAGAPDRTFALNGSGDALTKLNGCTEQLRKEWHVGRGYAGERASHGNPRPVLEAAVPAWTKMHMQPGKVQFVLLVDETGNVRGCDIQGTPGAPLLNELGCDLLRKDVTFEPARDRNGNAMKDNWWTPAVMVP